MTVHFAYNANSVSLRCSICDGSSSRCQRRPGVRKLWLASTSARMSLCWAAHLSSKLDGRYMVVVIVFVFLVSFQIAVFVWVSVSSSCSPFSRTET